MDTTHREKFSRLQANSSLKDRRAAVPRQGVPAREVGRMDRNTVSGEEEVGERGRTERSMDVCAMSV